MFRVLKIAFLVLVTVGALAAAFGVIVVVGVARLATRPSEMIAAAPPATQPAESPAPVAVAQPPEEPRTPILLEPADARLHGRQIRLDPKSHDVVQWTKGDAWLDWDVENTTAPHPYHVEVTYLCPPQGGGDFSVEFADQRLFGRSEPTDGQFRTVRIGTVHVPVGRNELCMKPAPDFRQHNLMRLRNVQLVPATPGEALTDNESPAPVKLMASSAQVR